MKSEILKMLLEGATYVSGQKMCEELHVSRTAVWKTMNQLKEEGYEIESVTNKGYRIISCPDLVTQEAIEGKIKTKVIGKHVHYQMEVGSTNTLAKQFAEEKNCHGLLVTADIQNSGKGRRGRSWVSPKGCGIWMTLVLKPELDPMNAPMLTLVAALAVAKGIREVTKLDAKIKWPNDIVVNKKKVCGILTEMNAELDFIHYVLIGIGINVNITEFPEEIKGVASSLYLESGNLINRSELICKSLEYFEEYYETFLNAGNLSTIMEEYNTFLINKGKMVKILGETQLVGTAKGINAKGELIVTVGEEDITVMSGEVSVRGLYEYV